MARFNTGNPIGSADPRDRDDNSKNLDLAVNDRVNDTWTDRFGVLRWTYSGIERAFDFAQESRDMSFSEAQDRRAQQFNDAESLRASEFSDSQEARDSAFISTQVDRDLRFNQFLASSGYQSIGDYEPGLVVTEYNQIFRYEGSFFRLKPSVDLPFSATNWADDSQFFVGLDDATLRQELTSPDGGDIVNVTTPDGIMTVTKALRDRRTVVNLSNYVDKTGGVFDQAKMEEAAIAAEGNILAVEPGTYLGSLRIRSNTTVIGAGMDLSIIKLPDEAPSDWHAITNEQNTGDPLTNSGNVNITIGDIQGDGNAFRDVTGSSGCAIQFANVTGLRAKNIKGYRGRLHCIDISSSDYRNAATEDFYAGSSSDVVLINPVGVDPRADDAITTHYSHNILIINPQCYMTGEFFSSSSGQGLEIDDGSYDVKVWGGHVKGFTKGLQIKGHADAVPARDVTVIGLTVEECEYNYDVQHGSVGASDQARNVNIIDCKSINPKVQGGYYVPQHGDFRDYTGLTVRNLECVGGASLRYGLGFRTGLRESLFENITFRDVDVTPSTTDGLIRFPNSGPVGQGVKLHRIRAYNCGPTPVIFSADTTNGIDVDDVYAERSGEEFQGVIKANIGTFVNPDTRITNIRHGSGYTHAIVDEDGVNSMAIPSGGSYGKIPTQWIRANSNGNVAGEPQFPYSVGWASGNQNEGPDETVGYGFYGRTKSGAPYLSAYIGASKHSWVDNDERTDIALATKGAEDEAPVVRWNVRQDGRLDPYVTAAYDVGHTARRVRQIYLSNSPDVSSDGRLKKAVRSANDAERAIALELKASGVFYQWKADEEGRQQFGWIAQTVEDIFAKHGLDANDYGMFRYDKESDGYSLILEQVTAFIVCNT